MSIRNLEAGKFYVNEVNSKVRQAMSVDGGDVFWRQFDLRTGETHDYDRGHCSTAYFVGQWATREATADEVARMQVETSNALLMEERNRQVKTALNLASNSELLTEVRQRHLLAKLTDDELINEVRRRQGDRIGQ